MTVADIIKNRLNAMNMTQIQLATSLNISRQNLSNKLKRDNFTAQELFEICKILNLKIVLKDVNTNDIDYIVTY